MREANVHPREGIYTHIFQRPRKISRFRHVHLQARLLPPSLEASLESITVDSDLPIWTDMEKRLKGRVCGAPGAASLKVDGML